MVQMAEEQMVKDHIDSIGAEGIGTEGVCADGNGAEGVSAGTDGAEGDGADGDGVEGVKGVSAADGGSAYGLGVDSIGLCRWHRSRGHWCSQNVENGGIE